MNVSPQAQAVLLLTAHFSKPRPDEAKPLTPTEWGKFAQWLRHAKLGPEALLAGDLREKLANWTDPHVTQNRIDRLLGRGSALALAIEKWLRSALWILTRSDPQYPARLKQRLKLTAPPVLFGCGNARLLDGSAVAVVGSRNAAEADLAYARQIGALTAQAGAAVVSGAARGVDEAAMLGALEVEGTAVGVLADSLLRASMSLKYRKYLLADNLALLSPFYPEAGFSAGNAMARNKYIYCLADAAIVVHSGTTGGTWNGALENLDRQWVPMWVKPTSDEAAGNAAIQKRGASWLPEEAGEVDVATLTAAADSQPPRAEAVTSGDRVAEGGAADSTGGAATLEHSEDTRHNVVRLPSASPSPLERREPSFYELFLLRIERACQGGPRTAADLAVELDVNKSQIADWLKRAVAEKKMRKISRPVRYEWVGDGRQRSFF
ncbi:MAG TPA: DNA-processing protein DprA [Gammaproteobacteria bacterium]|nr:DNA-processing protein DprA [Gammaproteobacteria bacterium]